MDNDNYIGYLKFSGDLVKDGFLDAKKSASALIGFDEAVRYYVGRQIPELQHAEYDFPVRIQQGSWEALIPTTIWQLIGSSLGIVVTTYLAKAAGKMAEKDFDGVGFIDIIRKALYAIQWFIKIGKHLGDLNQRKFDNIKFRNDNKEIGLLNENKEYLYVPKEYFDLYVDSNPRILERVTKIIEEERKLIIGAFRDGKVEEVTITKKYRAIFTQEESNPDNYIFPELTHGQKVTLEGDVTRGNEPANSIGLKYKGHILTCYPEAGSVVRFKPSLFLKAKIHGTISRDDNRGTTNAKKPKIIFSSIEPIEEGEGQPTLLDIDNTK